MNPLRALLFIIIPFLVSVVGVVYFHGIKEQGLPPGSLELPLVPVDSMVVEEEDTTGLGALALLSREDVEREDIERLQDIKKQIQYLQQKIEEYQTKQQELVEKENELDTREIVLSGQERTFQQQSEEAINTNLQLLARMYENMRADMAAPIISTMGDTLIVRVLRNMKERNSGRILAIIGNEGLVEEDRIKRLNELFRDMPQAGIVVP